MLIRNGKILSPPLEIPCIRAGAEGRYFRIIISYKDTHDHLFGVEINKSRQEYKTINAGLCRTIEIISKKWG